MRNRHQIPCISCHLSPLRQSLSTPFRSDLVDANIKFMKSSLDVWVADLWFVMQWNRLQLWWNPESNSETNGACPIAHHLHRLHFNRTRDWTELTNLHLHVVVWLQSRFLHQWKLCANHASPVTYHWRRLHSKPVRTCEQLGRIGFSGHCVYIRLIVHDRRLNQLGKPFHRSLAHHLRRLLMTNHRFDKIHAHRQTSTFYSESSSRTDCGSHCVRRADSCIETVIFSSRMEHWQ
jgi:hypothetical protein